VTFVQLASFEVTPTVGFSEETFEKGKLRFQVFDMAGGGAYHGLHRRTAHAVQRGDGFALPPHNVKRETRTM